MVLCKREKLLIEQLDAKRIAVALKNVVFTSPDECTTVEKYFLTLSENIFKLSKTCLLMSLRTLITKRNAVVFSEIVVSTSPGRRTTVEKYFPTLSGNIKLSKNDVLNETISIL